MNGFSGLDQMETLMRQIEEMGQNVNSEVMDKALQAGSEIVKEKIENHPNMPVSRKNKEHARDHFAIVKTYEGNFDIGVEADYFYLLFHEIGTEGGTYRGKNNQELHTPKINAKPFVRPAFESNRDEIQQAMMDVVKRELGL